MHINILSSHITNSLEHTLFCAEKQISIRRDSAKHTPSDAACLLMAGQLQVVGDLGATLDWVKPVMSCFMVLETGAEGKFSNLAN